MNEIWKDVVGYEGYYKVSNLGKVKCLARSVYYWRGGLREIKEKVLNPHKSKGYYHVTIYADDIVKTKKVHQLVAESFLGHVANGHKLVVNHIDRNTTNNVVDNLEIVTQRENANQKHIKSVSKYTGVSWHKHNKRWRSRIYINGKDVLLGYFKSEYHAAMAYEKALKKL